MRNLLFGLVIGALAGWMLSGRPVRAQGRPQYHQVATPGRGWIDCVVYQEAISCLPQR